jgi:predicted dehydrogenase
MKQPMPAPLRIGFIGASFIAQVVHLPSFAAVSGVTIAALADPRRELREAVAEQFGAVPVTHHQELLADPAIDAVVISVYRRCQAPLAALALAAGKPVFSEKPLAYSYAEAATNVALAKAKDLPYAVGYMKRCDAGVRQFRTLLHAIMASGELGDLLHVQARDFCPTNDIAPPPHVKPFFPSLYRYDLSPPGPAGLPSEYVGDYDYTLNVMSHDINLLHYLFGPIFRAERFAVRSKGVQTAQLAAANFDVSLVAGLSDRGSWDQEIELLFRNGRLRLILPSPMDRTGTAAIEITRAGSAPERIRPTSDAEWSFAAQAAHFAAACRGANLDCPASDVLADLSLIESLWERVTWNL